MLCSLPIGFRKFRNSCTLLAMWIVELESIHQVLVGTSVKSYSKQGKNTFLFKPILVFETILLHMSQFLTKKAIHLFSHPASFEQSYGLQGHHCLFFFQFPLLWFTIWVLLGATCFNLSLFWTHMVNNSLRDHLSLCVLQEILKGPYSRGNESRMKWTRNDLEISTFRDFSLVALFHISIMCSRTLLLLSNFMLESFFIKVLATDLSELINFSSIAFI